MTMPFYAPPEQVMKDKADYARKGIARGRSLVALRYHGGIAIVAENTSSTLRKVSEIYDRIAFAGVGRYNEFDQLRIAGVRHADLKGFAFSREDVDARSLANAYAQSLGQVFTHEIKPMEVEILVAEIGLDAEGRGDQLFHILYDGTVADEDDWVVLGGETEEISERFADALPEAPRSLAEGVRAAVAALAGPDRTLSAEDPRPRYSNGPPPAEPSAASATKRWPPSSRPEPPRRGPGPLVSMGIAEPRRQECYSITIDICCVLCCCSQKITYGSAFDLPCQRGDAFSGGDRRVVVLQGPDRRARSYAAPCSERSPCSRRGEARSRAHRSPMMSARMGLRSARDLGGQRLNMPTTSFDGCRR